MTVVLAANNGFRIRNILEYLSLPFLNFFLGRNLILKQPHQKESDTSNLRSHVPAFSPFTASLSRYSSPLPFITVIAYL